MRQDFVVAPAAAAHLRPAVEVRRVAADVQHAVDRGGAAEDAAARPVDGAAGGAGFGLGGEHPVHLWVVDELEHAGGDVDPG